MLYCEMQSARSKVQIELVRSVPLNEGVVSYSTTSKPISIVLLQDCISIEKWISLYKQKIKAILLSCDSHVTKNEKKHMFDFDTFIQFVVSTQNKFQSWFIWIRMKWFLFFCATEIYFLFSCVVMVCMAPKSHVLMSRRPIKSSDFCISQVTIPGIFWKYKNRMKIWV